MQTEKGNLDAMAQELLNSPAGSKIASKESELKKLTESDDGKKIQAMLAPEADNLKAAVENGDTAKLKKTIKNIMHTDEGARLMQQLSEMFK